MILRFRLTIWNVNLKVTTPVLVVQASFRLTIWNVNKIQEEFSVEDKLVLD